MNVRLLFALTGCALAACRSPGGGARGEARPGAIAPVTPTSATAASVAASSSAPPAKDDAAASPGPPAEPLPQVTTDWCVEGLAALDEETCYVLPTEVDGGGGAGGTRDAAGRPGPVLLVYLHGIVPPTAESEQKERVERAVLHTSRRAGVAAIVPRGVRGIGPSGARDWWAWPTEPSAHAKYAARLVAKWAGARERLERIAGVRFARTYLAGSSNGAYFLTALALRGDLARFGFSVDGYGAMSGGSTGGRGASSLPPAARRPFYVGYGAYDETTKTSARALGEVLARAGWPVRVRELPVGHGAREEYLDEAFGFWRQAE
jgi:predicted esterase